MHIIRYRDQYFFGFVSVHPGTDKTGHLEPVFNPSKALVISDEEIDQTGTELSRFVDGFAVLYVEG